MSTLHRNSVREGSYQTNMSRCRLLSFAFGLIIAGLCTGVEAFYLPNCISSFLFKIICWLICAVEDV